MNYSFHPAASQELNDAIDYYEECKSGLGLEFAKEVYTALHNILLYPHAWAELSQNTRRCLTNRFPYGIVYLVSKNEVVIIAIMQLNRQPEYWKERTKT